MNHQKGSGRERIFSMPKYNVTVEQELEVSPCPFCALTDLRIEHSKNYSCWYVHCNNCNADGPVSSLAAHQGDAVKLWNGTGNLTTNLKK